MPSPIEHIKEKSRSLRGAILETLKKASETHFSEEDAQVLKFHGCYQQDNRDLRNERKKQGLDKAWIFMVRTKCPGGALSASQYLSLDKLSDAVGNGTLRITTRQGIQLHGVVFGGLRRCISSIIGSGIHTWGACGDIVRNVVASPSPIKDGVHDQIQQIALSISNLFLSKSKAYTEIWINSIPVEYGLENENQLEEEPIYGKVYLPRKFKIGFVIPPHNDVDIYSQDLGFVTHVSANKIEGFTVLVGGSHGMTHGIVKTYPKLAVPLFFIPLEKLSETAIAIVQTQRDFGNREDRKRARLKYLIDERGIDWFRSEVCSRLSFVPEEPKPFSFSSVSDRLGWHSQGDGKYFLGIRVENGRIGDFPSLPLRSILRNLIQDYQPSIRLTPNANILLCDIDEDKKEHINRLLVQNRLFPVSLKTVARNVAHACVALPTCGLALAESERVFPQIMDKIEEILVELGLSKEEILIRMSGCPNGCSRPYNADIAFVGRAPNRYALYVGGSIAGDRLASLQKRVVELADIPSVVREYLEDFVQNRRPEESFSQYWQRINPGCEESTPQQFHQEQLSLQAKNST
ncbi:NADPH-dependent assimilatory sulfite reductase hemoprotein subunit [Methylacidiphilum caldifontis]|uniref:Sulfite reductase subunit beta n=1 Tax=Methylacidiphilum caldifontis TaxID=2795386 RepID=A0A4Y8PH03_9BACT|nr:NADPH-dependent assimilatory sulfite reductase hemoprotein subunit [Methylacidiphilum caldifontis]QSR88500.1 NADPH-dependent assimilatory sulfite reductase hemoprotein subunit [Methylacidiphilum caldifontis]TFE71326.1 sulfite reductase subunit beta [Methylacidiphilum caldifontis]